MRVIRALLFMACALQAQAAWTFIQAITPSSYATGSTKSFSSDVTAGNGMVAVLNHFFAGCAPSLTDSQGNTWTNIPPNSIVTGNTGLFVFVAPAQSGPETVTITTACSSGVISIAEYTPNATAVAANSGDGNAAAFATVNPCDSSAVTTTANGDLILGFFQSSSGAISAGSGFTSRAATSLIMLEEKIQTTAGSISATASCPSVSGGNQVSSSVITLKSMPPFVATNKTCALAAGTYANLAATAGHWTGIGCTGGAYVPASPDVAVIPASGVTLTLASGDSAHWGDATATSGRGLSMTAGVSNVSFSTLTVATGAVLQLDGFDASANSVGIVGRYAHFTVQGTLYFHTKAGAENNFQADGVTSYTGTVSGLPADNNWNNTGTYVATNITNSGGSANSTACGLPDPRQLCFFLGGDIASGPGNYWLSNSTGTGPGSFGNSSLSFTGVSCSPTACTGGLLNFVTEVSSLAAVTSAGTYYVDYALGLLYWYQAAGTVVPGPFPDLDHVSFTAHYKYLSFDGTTISSTANTTYNDFSAVGATLNYLGTAGALVKGSLTCGTKLTPGAGGTSQGCVISGNTFNYVKRPIWLSGVTGVVGDPVRVEGNHFLSLDQSVVQVTGSNNNYLSVRNNTGATRGGFLFVSTSGSFPGWVVQNNILQANVFMAGSNALTLPGLLIDSNVVTGWGSTGDNRVISQVAGSGSGANSSTISNNLVTYSMRFGNYKSYESWLGNVILRVLHHGMSSEVSVDNIQYTGVTFANQIFSNSLNASSPLDFGYNARQWTDLSVRTHNTSDLMNGVAAMCFTDCTDNFNLGLITRLTDHSNMITNGAGASRFHSPATDTSIDKLNLTISDWANVYGNSPQYKNGWTRFATFSGLTNVTGVSLFNPSSAGPLTGKTLTLTYTSPSNITLTWDSGTPVQLAHFSSTATGGTVQGLVDSTQSWTTDYRTPTTTPAGEWVKITSGAASGGISRITAMGTFADPTGTTDWVGTNPATSVTFATALGSAVAAGNTYNTYFSEVTLTAADASTVQAGVYLPDLPASTQSDTSVSMVSHTTAYPPQYVDSSRSLASWDASLGGTGTDATAMARLTANTSLVSSAVAYIRAGYATQQPLLWGAGFDGLDIGAVHLPVVQHIPTAAMIP